jgi:hypothetical protein
MEAGFNAIALENAETKLDLLIGVDGNISLNNRSRISSSFAQTRAPSYSFVFSRGASRIHKYQYDLCER